MKPPRFTYRRRSFSSPIDAVGPAQAPRMGPISTPIKKAGEWPRPNWNCRGLTGSLALVLVSGMLWLDAGAMAAPPRSQTVSRQTEPARHRESIMRKVIAKEEMAILKEAGEMFNETGCVPGVDGEQVPAERMVPDAKEYILEAIDDPEATYDSEIWDTPGFTLVLFWLTQKWQQRCNTLAHRRTNNPEKYLTKEQQKACLDSAAVELIREISQQPPLN
jgi:hypothetical protein